MPSRSITAAKDATARLLVEAGDRKVKQPAAAPGGLCTRVASAAVMAPVTLLAVYAGAPIFPLFVAALAALLAWEWELLCGSRRFGASGMALVLALLLATAAAGAGRFDLAAILLMIGTGTVFAVALASRRPSPTWTAAGVPYIGIACIALIWLRADADFGRISLFWLLAVVWATDIGAYATGRTAGGPRLAPRISPNKTWSGFLGGTAAAAAGGGALAVAAGLPGPLWVAAVSAVVSIAAQSGDLAESVFKRHFGVKDTSRLIPGHGGLLDRLDSIHLAAPVVALLIWVAGSNVLTWS
jgi:phosphatidate cytidylyltransferase